MGSLDSDDIVTSASLPITELIKRIKYSFRERDFNEFQDVLMELEDNIEKEIENFKRNHHTEKLGKSQKKCQELVEVVARLNEEKRVLTDRVILAEEARDIIFTENLKMTNEKNNSISELNEKIKELENKNMESERMIEVYREKSMCLDTKRVSKVGLSLDSQGLRVEKENSSTNVDAEVVVVDALSPSNGSSDNVLSKKGARNSVNPRTREGIDNSYKGRTSPGKQSGHNPPQEENTEPKEPLGSGAHIGGMQLLSSSHESSRSSPAAAGNIIDSDDKIKTRSAKRKLDNEFEETTPAEKGRDKMVSKKGTKLNMQDKSIRSQKRKRQEKFISTPSQSTRSKKVKITEENVASDSDFETIKRKTNTKGKTNIKKKYIANRTLQFRCTMPNFIAYNDAIPLGAQDIIAQTPFARLFVALRDNLIHWEKSNNQLGMLLEAYDHENDVFVFANKKFKLKTSHISQILGLSCEGDVVGMKTGPMSDFIKEAFGVVTQIKKKDVTNAILYELKQQPDNLIDKKNRDERLAKLIILDIFIKLLFPNGMGSLPINMVRAVDDLDEISTYAWAKEVEISLKRSLACYKKYNRVSKNTGGCTILILYWFCMKTNVVAPIRGAEEETHLIRKWDLKTLKMWLKKHSFKDLSKHFRNKKEDISDSSDEDNEENDESVQRMGNQRMGKCATEVITSASLENKLHEQGMAIEKLLAITSKLNLEVQEVRGEMVVLKETVASQNMTIHKLESDLDETVRKEQTMKGAEDENARSEVEKEPHMNKMASEIM